MPDIGRILCPVDFSQFSDRALADAATLARWYGAELHGLHVVPALPTLWRVAPTLGPHMPPGVSTGHVEVALDTALRPAGAAGVHVVAEVREGDPTRWILDYAAREGIDLIVMGTHGRGGVERLVLGSVTENVLRQSVCPVLTVCRGAKPDADGPPFKRILCALDFAPASGHGLAYAVSMTKEADAELTLLHVTEPYEEGWLHEHAPMSAQEYRAFIEGQLKARLQNAVAPEVREWCRTEDRLETGRPWEQIVRVATDVDAQLIVMGQHVRSAADALLFGSTTHEVVRHAPCPVLTASAVTRPQWGLVGTEKAGVAG